MKTLMKLMRRYGKESILAPLFKMLEASFELLIPLVVAAIVDTGLGTGDRNYVVQMCLVMVALGIVGLVCAVVAQYFSAKAAVGVAARFRHRLMERILGLSYTQIDNVGYSTLITRMTSDVNQVQTGVNLALRLLLRSPFVVFGAMIMAFTINFDAALIFAGVILVLCVVVFGIMLITMPMYKKVQEGLDHVTSATRQNLSGVRVLRAFCKEQAEIEAYGQCTDELTHRQKVAGRISGLMNPVTFVIVNLAVVILVQVGAMKVESGILTQGMVIALYNYMTQILVELIKMANLIITMTKAAVCANRIEAVLDIPVESAEGADLAICTGKIEFKDVTAVYDGASEASLEHISFTAQPGQTIGIIGGTGSGKTTLVNLIPGFYNATDGQVLVDGIDVRELNKQQLRDHIGIVPQKAVLFHGSIRENLLWGREDATDEDIWLALETAQAASVVRDKDGQLDGEVTQGGTNFSGGQRQRLTIARALVRKPSVLILDDSASALDYATDAALRGAIRKMENPPTTFIVSQRAASVRFADIILVLDDGLLVGQGTHEQLLESCEVYQEIYYSQFPKEVVGNG
ncbi:MAG: ABC transporter ATP-binding protein [Ruminococcaceae bacterium]|nr:ABC transporter ATP-binding protein [Oscillospiraceae bacterium]